jgi:GSCFA family
MKRNPELKFLLTVSPVPLTATASDKHVLVATTYSKSVLRAVAGTLAEGFENVDYFPSFDLLSSASTRGVFHSDDARQITEPGVEAVMRIFFDAQPALAQAPAPVAAGEQDKGRAASLTPEDPAAEAVCEDILLDAFSR